MATKSNAKKSISAKPAKKASPKKSTSSKGGSSNGAPAKKGVAKKDSSKKDSSKKVSNKKGFDDDKELVPAARKRPSRSIDEEADGMMRMDDGMSEFEDEDQSPRDEDAEASAYASDGDDEAEAEARDLDLDEVAEAAQLEEHAPADDADMPDAEDLGEAMGLDDVMPLPATGYGDDFDPEDMMAMSAFQSRSVLGAEERNAVIQEVKQRAEKNGGYVTTSRRRTSTC